MNDLIKRDDAIECLEKVKECLVLDDQMFVDCLIDDIKRIEPFGKGEQHEIDFSSSKIPNNSDTISRQAAIDAIEITPFDDYGDYMRARELIEQLPSAQPQWIPISKTLPKKDGLYLCWYEYYHWSKEKVLPEYGIGYYDVKLKFWGGEVANGKDAKVLAWMSLPDPYKGKQE